MNKSLLIKDAHKLAKTFTGNYSACLALALKILWTRMKASAKTKMVYVMKWIALKNKMVSYHDNINTIDYDKKSYFDIMWEIVKETEKAFQVRKSQNEKLFWVPKSQCQLESAIKSA